jgi:hypothetical protein
MLVRAINPNSKMKKLDASFRPDLRLGQWNSSGILSMLGEARRAVRFYRLDRYSLSF